MVRPSQRREMAKAAVECGRSSVRHACQTFALSETCYRYEAKLADENAVLADWLGSNTMFFPYHDQPLPLPEYWLHAQRQAAAALDDAIGQRALAVVDVGDDGEVADVVHRGSMGSHGTTRSTPRATGCRPGGRSVANGRRTKKKARRKGRRAFQQKRMATACWDFIVAKTPR